MNYVILEKVEKAFEGSYYIDFDKTLAYHETEWGIEKIGNPIPKMISRVKNLIRQGKKVKILTARATSKKSVKQVQDWLEENGLPRLEVTNVKGKDLVELWDDRAREVIPNTGEFKV